MKLKVLDPNLSQAHWLEVHADGCADLRKRARHSHQQRGEGAFTIEADTLSEAAAKAASDFIAEGSMTLESALKEIHFAPCVKLAVR